MGLPFTGVVQRSLSSMSIDLLHDLDPLMQRDQHGIDPAVALDQTEHDHLAGRAPASLVLSDASECGFVALNRTFERLPELLDLARQARRRR